MTGPAATRISYGPNGLVRFLGFTQLIGGLGGLFEALTRDQINPSELALLGVMIMAGAPLAFWRVGLVVDRGAGTLTKWWGVLVPFSRQVQPLAAITHVRLTKQLRHTSKGTQVTFPVMLMRKDIGEVRLWDAFSYARARQRAEALAKLLSVDLHDESSGEPVVRESRFLDEPLVDRYRRLGTLAPFREPPPGAAARILSRSPALAIEIPAAGFRWSHLAVPVVLVWFLLALVGGGYLAGVADPQHSGLWILFAIVVSPGLLGAVLLTVHVATVREIITASPAGIEIETRGWLRRQTRRIAASQVEEIVAAADLRQAPAGATSRAIAYSAGARAVLIRTDKGNTGVGRWVSEAEQAWLRDMLVHGLLGGARPPAAGPAASAPTPGVVVAAPLGNRLKWLAGALALGAALILILPRISGTLQTPTVPAGFELTPGPGSGYILIYGRGVQASARGPDVRITIDEIRLAENAKASTGFRDLSLSVHRRVEGKWRLVGAASGADIRSTLDAGGAYAYPGPQEFTVAGAAETCLREPCHFRVHVLGQVGTGRPGWDVTELAPLRLR